MKLVALFLCLYALPGNADSPELAASNVLNGASRIAGPVSPGEIIVLFPSNAGPDRLAASRRAGEGIMVTELDRTRVLFDGIAAPLVYSVKGEVSAVVPYEVDGKSVTQVEVEYQGIRSAAVTLPVVSTVPAIFILDSSGKGQAAILNETGCCNSARNPATRGSVVSLYATGEGQTVPAGISGSFSVYERIEDYPKPQAAVHVTIGGIPAEILYVAEARDSVAGQLLVNVRIPLSSPLGDAVPLTLTIGDARSPDGVTMAVRSEIRTVLIMNRDAAARNWLQGVLSRAGFAVVTAADGNAHPADLIISSVTVPVEETQAAIAAMRAVRPQVRVMIAAPVLTPDVLRSADELGAQGVLAKHWTEAMVAAKVREVLRPKLAVYNASDVPKLVPGRLPLYR